jgi:D-3-phosphoglycerate dehydrogenase
MQTEKDIVICGTEKFVNKHPSVQYIVCNCTNVNHIDPGEATIISLKDESAFLDCITATAEHTIRLMLNLVAPKTRQDAPGKTLAGKTLGIIGYGRIGKQVAARAKALGMVYFVHDTDLKTCKDNLLKCDFVSLHTTIEKNQNPILGLKELNRMKAGAYLINTSRAEAISVPALNIHINRLGGVASDFPISGYIDKQKNVIITPHIGGYCIESLLKTARFCFMKLKEEINAENAKRQDPSKGKTGPKRIKRDITHF